MSDLQHLEELCPLFLYAGLSDLLCSYMDCESLYLKALKGLLTKRAP